MSHRYLRKVIVICVLLELSLPRAFLQWPIRVPTRQTRQAVFAINKSIFLRYLWHEPDTKIHLSKKIRCHRILRQPQAKLYDVYGMSLAGKFK